MVDKYINYHLSYNRCVMMLFCYRSVCNNTNEFIAVAYHFTTKATKIFRGLHKGVQHAYPFILVRKGCPAESIR
jgi:hypothetical protein